MKNYYQKQANKLLKMNIEEAENKIKLIRKFNGCEEADKIIEEVLKINVLNTKEVPHECLLKAIKHSN